MISRGTGFIYAAAVPMQVCGDWNFKKGRTYCLDTILYAQS